MENVSEIFEMNQTTVVLDPQVNIENVTTLEMVTFSTLFIIVGTIGILGNCLVMYIVLRLENYYN